MLNKTLVVTRQLPHEVELRIARDYVARFNTDDRLYTSDKLISASAGADALLINSQDHMDAQVLSRLGSSVHPIATVTVGFDHIDLAATANGGITVTNTRSLA